MKNKILLHKKGGHLRITEKEVRDAVRKFKEEGGLIRMLPKEIAPNRLMVGEHHGFNMNIHEH